MDLATQLTKDMIKAMKARDNTKLDMIKQLKADLVNKKIALGHKLSKKDEITVLTHEVKQHKQSISAFKKGKRPDLVKEQEANLKIIQHYAPKPLSEDQVDALITKAIKQTGASSMKDFGKVMGFVMSKAQGRTNGKVVNKIVRKYLSK